MTNTMTNQVPALEEGEHCADCPGTCEQPGQIPCSINAMTGTATVEPYEAVRYEPARTGTPTPWVNLSGGRFYPTDQVAQGKAPARRGI